MKKIIKHYPMTDRLIVRRGYKKGGQKRKKNPEIMDNLENKYGKCDPK